MEKWQKLGKIFGGPALALGVILGIFMSISGSNSYGLGLRPVDLLFLISVMCLGLLYLVMPVSIFLYRYKQGSAGFRQFLHMAVAIGSLPLTYWLLVKSISMLNISVPGILAYGLLVTPWCLYMLYFKSKGSMETVFIQNLNVVVIMIAAFSFLGITAVSGVADLDQAFNDEDVSSACISAANAQCRAAIHATGNSSVLVQTPGACLNDDGEVLTGAERAHWADEVASDEIKCQNATAEHIN